MYSVNGRYVSAAEARRLRGLDKKETPAEEIQDGEAEQPKKTKKEIVDELTAKGLEFDPKAKKEELETLLSAALAAEVEADAEEAKV